MTYTEIRARMNYLIGEAERDQVTRRCFNELGRDHKWTLSPDVFTQLEENYDAYRVPLDRLEKIVICGIPVTIDYRTRGKIELWRKLGED